MDELLTIIAGPALLAQFDDDSASSSTILIGLLLLGGLILFVIYKNTKSDAESLGKHADRLTKKVNELNQELEKTTSAKQALVKAPNLAKLTRAFRVVHVDEEHWFLATVSSEIDRKFKNVIVVGFHNFDEAWEELQRADPDLLILNKNGHELLRLLAQRKVKYPILVLLSSLTNEVFDLNVSFLKKPFDKWEKGVVSKWTKEQLCAELSKHIKPIPVLKVDASVLPNRMQFQIVGYSESHKINHIGAGILEYHSTFNENWGEPIYLNPDRSHWKQFWRDLDSVGTWKWKTSYQTHGITDGTHWQLDLDFREHSLQSEGDGAYPDGNGDFFASDSDFGLFLIALARLTGLETIT